MVRGETVEEAAEAMREAPPARRGRGRPRGSRTRSRQREPDAEPDQPAPDPEQVKAMDAQLSIALVALWKAVGKASRLPPPLEPHEVEALADTSKVVVYKYLPDVLLSVGPELALIGAVASVFGPRWIDAQERAAEAREARARRGGVRDGQEHPSPAPGLEVS